MKKKSTVEHGRPCLDILGLSHRVAMLGVATLVALFLCVTGCKAEIQHGLKEDQANEIVTVLRKAGILAEKEKEKGRKPTFTVSVPKKDAAEALSILSARHLPKKPRKGVYELFGKSSLVPTSTEEHMKKVYATASELGKTLEQMEGVLDARVHLVLPQKGFLDSEAEEKEKPRASVYLKVVPGGAPATVPQVQGLVAGAVSDLNPSSVSVLIQTGKKVDLSKKTASGATPFWFKYLAIGASAAVLVLGVLLALVALRMKRLREENQTLAREGTGTINTSVTSSRSAGV